MKQSFYDELPYKIKYGGKVFYLTPYFNRVLAVFDTQQRNDLTNNDKLDLSLYLLANKANKIRDKAAVLNCIFDLLIEPGKNKSDKKCVDFIQDAPYIYAGFMQAYRIDLFEEQNRMHWWKFLSLFRALPDDVRIMQIMSIRSKPIPKATQYNRDEINQLIQLKHEYALEISQEEREKQYADGLKKIAKALGGLANEKN